MKVAGRLIGAGVVLCAALCGPAFAQTQDYPNKVVRFISDLSAGRKLDVMARIVGQKLTEYWGQQVIVDSKPGGGRLIGMESASRQPPDGYTFLLGNFGPVVAKPLLPKSHTTGKRICAGARDYDLREHSGGPGTPPVKST